jgi:tRNA pseudouridine13 synthase
VPRFTDFLVFEVDLDDKSIHLESIGKPASPGNDNDISPGSTARKDASTESDDDDSSQKANVLVWQDHFTTALAPFLDPERIQQIKDMYLQGRDPPRISDSGWAGRKTRPLDEENGPGQSLGPTTTPSEVEQGHITGSRNNKIALKGPKMVDDRRVISEVLVSNSLNLRDLTLIVLSLSP